MPAEEERRHESVAPLTTGRRGGKAALGFYKSREMLFPTVSPCFTFRKWLQSKETSLPHFLAAFNEGTKHK